MTSPHQPRRIEIFDRGSRVYSAQAANSCNSLSVSYTSEKSPFTVDCGRRKWVCPPGWRYYSGYARCVGGTTNGSCWKRAENNRGNAAFCGYKNWHVRRPSSQIVPEQQTRRVAIVYEYGETTREIGRWTSGWFCMYRPEDRAAYNAVSLTQKSYLPVWCPEETMMCGSPCSGDSDWCCLNCQQVASKIEQLARAAQAIRDRLYD